MDGAKTWGFLGQEHNLPGCSGRKATANWHDKRFRRGMLERFAAGVPEGRACSLDFDGTAGEMPFGSVSNS